MRVKGIVLKNRADGGAIILEKAVLGMFDEPRYRGVLVFSPKHELIKAFKSMKGLKEWFKNNKEEIEELVIKHGHLDVLVVQSLYVIRKRDEEW